MLRDGALSDSVVIEYVNRNLVPVWVNVRSDAYPRVPALLDRDWVMFPTAEGQVTNPYYLAYLARAYVLTPDLQTLLNEEDGMFAQGGVDGEPFIDMLRSAVGRYRPPPTLAAGQMKPAVSSGP